MTLVRWWQRLRGARTASRASLDTAVQALAAEPDALDLAKLTPLVVPRAFSETGDWPGPIVHLAAPGFDKTWAIVEPGGAIVYVSRAVQAFWERNRVDWRDRAARNLQQTAESHPYNGRFAREDGSDFMVSMLYENMLGPARLLAPHLLTRTLGDGYLVAVPEITCALAFTANPSAHEREKIDAVVANCFALGTEPVSPEHIPAELFWETASADVGGPSEA